MFYSTKAGTLRTCEPNNSINQEFFSKRQDEYPFSVIWFLESKLLPLARFVIDLYPGSCDAQYIMIHFQLDEATVPGGTIFTSKPCPE